MAVRSAGIAEDKALKKRKQPPPQTPMFRSAAEMRTLRRAEREFKKAGLGHLIATRLLAEEKTPGLHVTVKIGEPRQLLADEWRCPFSIEGIVESGVRFAGGVDALQALILAISGVRHYLEQTGRHFTWLGDDNGVPLQVTNDYGKTFEKRVRKLIDRAEKQFQLRRIRIRKTEIARAEARLKALKKSASRYQEPAGKADLEVEISEREARLKFGKKVVADWEGRVRKWNP